MKATLEFDLPEEYQEHQDALNGGRWRCAFEEVGASVRSFIKYGHSFQSPNEALERIATIINDERQEMASV